MASGTAIIDASKFLMIFFMTIPSPQDLDLRRRAAVIKDVLFFLRTHFGSGLEEILRWNGTTGPQRALTKLFEDSSTRS